jgi:hypothetical protein
MNGNNFSYPISENDIKCRISEGCFFAIGSFAKFKLEKVAGENDSGTDFRLMKLIKRNDKVRDVGGILDFQLKCTSSWEDEGNFIKYNLKSKNYNDIISRNVVGGMPLVLILMCVPREIDWIDFTSEEIIFRKNLFWFHTDSMDILGNENSTKTIRIPKEHRFNPESFSQIVSEYAVKRLS